MHPLEIEHRHARRLAPGPGRRRNREKWTQRTRNGESLSDRRIHVVEEVSGWMGRVEVGDLRRVDGRSAADGDKRVARLALGHVNRIAKRAVGRLNAHVVVEDDVNVVVLERLEHRGYGRQGGDDTVRDHHYPMM